MDAEAGVGCISDRFSDACHLKGKGFTDGVVRYLPPEGKGLTEGLLRALHELSHVWQEDW